MDFESEVRKAKEILEAGGIILYPTDTLWGLGVDATNSAALEALYSVKKREANKPVSFVFRDWDQVEEFAVTTESAKRLNDKFLPGALTVILESKFGKETIGVRIPDSRFCFALSKEFGKPFTATSANVSGEAPLNDPEEILVQLNTNVPIHVVQTDENLKGKSSTVVDCRGDTVKIIRERAIAAAEIFSALE